MQNIDSDLIRGNIDTIILKTMLNEDKYGLDIIKEVSDKSNGTYELKQPTLYSCLKRLENQGLISSYWVDSEIGGKRHYYKLTDKGREFYNKKQEEWAKSKFIIDNLLSNYNYEEYRLVKKDDFDEIIQNKANAPLSNFTDNANDENNTAEENSETFEPDDENSSELEETNLNENTSEDDNNENISENSLSSENLNSSEDEDIDNQSSITEEDETDDYSSNEFENENNNLTNYSEENSDESDENVESESAENFSDYEISSNNESQDFESENEDDNQNEDFENENASDFSIHDAFKNSNAFEDIDDEDSLKNSENEDDYFSENNPDETEISNDEVLDLGNNEDNNILTDDDSEEAASFSSNSDDEDYPVYFSAKQSKSEADDNTVSYETTDQSSNEMNILSRLHSQDDETINTYYGDQKSYVNHLNQIDESKLEQQDLLDGSLYVKPDLVNKSIDDFSSAVERLNNFNSSVDNSEETSDQAGEETKTPDIEDFENDTQSYEEQEIEHDAEDNDEVDDLDELNSLKNISSNGFFNSSDNAGYETQQTSSSSQVQNDYDFNQTDSSDASFDEDDYEPENTAPMSFSEITNEIESNKYNESTYTNDNDYSETDTENQTESSFDSSTSSQENYNAQENMNAIDSIISNNISTNYVEPTQAFYRGQNSNYREKLSSLSKYSKVALENEKPTQNNEEAIEKAKDIAEITKELEDEGIKVREHYKQTNSKALDKNYLLANKINLMRSLIMFFGYVFILSAVYIVLNNTPMKDNSWFSFKPFLIGFIPFAVILIYYTILFVISPYKKVDAKFHARIMLFISVIITIQLLLITYCVNLQLGFYSFTQKEYNHLLWIIPTIISFAPIIDNFVYLALFKSKNFNV